MTKSKKLLSLFLALVMVFSVACGKPQGEQKQPTEEGDNQSTEGNEENNGGEDTVGESEIKEVTIAGSNSLANMDYTVTSKRPDHTWNANFVDGLLEHDRLGQLKGALAESWEVSEDGLTWTFNLREGVKWVTNQGIEYADVVADDFVTGLRHAAEFNSETSSLVAGIIKGYAEYLNSDFSDEAWDKVGIEAKDDYTLVYTLEKPAPYFGDITTYSILFPINREFLEASGEGSKLGSPDPLNSSFGSLSPDSILYNGGYILTTVDQKSQIVMEKNENYWDADKVLVEKVTEIYDDGSDPYSIKKGYENGTYPSMSMKPTWEDYNKIRSEYEEFVRPNNPDGTVYGLSFTYDRQVFDHSKYASDEKLKEATRKAVLNENFRKALRAAYNRQAELEIDAPAELAKQAKRNINNFPDAGHATDGRDYHQIVTDVYNKNTGEDINLVDGEDPFYGKEKAMEYIEAAKSEGVEFPIHLDMLVIETSDRLTKMANSVKQSVAENTDGNIIIELVLLPQDDVMALAFQNEDPKALDYDISTFSGWGPDYNDPKSFVNVWSTTVGDYMKNSGIATVDENGELLDKDLKDQLGFTEYEELYREADEIVDDNDARLEAFAKADSLLIEKALYVPQKMSARAELVSKAIPYEGNYALVGLSAEKWKGRKFQSEPITAEEYKSIREQWEKDVADLAAEEE